MHHCPRCRHPLLTDPATGQPPAQCPHCGAALVAEASHGPSLASFLHAGSAVPPFNPVVPLIRLTDPTPAASPVPQDTPTTPDGAPVHPAVSTDTTPELAAPATRTPTGRAQDDPTPPQGHAGSTLDIQHDTAPVPASRDTDQPAVQLAASQAAAPSFVRHTRPGASRVPTWQWAALALLTGALGIQMLIADRARLAQDALWRPVLEHACGALRCMLPAWHQPQAYTMLAREVKAVPGVPGVLQVRASFRNDARWPQRWPAVALSLSDADGRVAGARVLVPADYLATGQRMTTLAPGQSGQMAVQVREPPGGVVAFTFEFR